MRLASGATCAALAFGASLALAQTKPDARHSGYHDMGPALQKMQADMAAAQDALAEITRRQQADAVEPRLRITAMQAKPRAGESFRRPGELRTAHCPGAG